MQSNFIQKQNEQVNKTFHHLEKESSPRLKDLSFEVSPRDNREKPSTGRTLNSYRSEIIGNTESKELMRGGVGRFSRLERFRMRTKGGMVSKRGHTGSRTRKVKLANSVFESVTKPRFSRKKTKQNKGVFDRVTSDTSKKPKAPIKLGMISKEDINASETQPKKLLSFSNIPDVEDDRINQQKNESSNNQLTSLHKINESKYSESETDPKANKVDESFHNEFDPFSENFGTKITPPPSTEKRQPEDMRNFSFHNSNLMDSKADDLQEKEDMKFQYKTLIIKEESDERSNSVKTDRLRMSEYMHDQYKSRGLKMGTNPIIQSMVVRKNRPKSEFF